MASTHEGRRERARLDFVAARHAHDGAPVAARVRDLHRQAVGNLSFRSCKPQFGYRQFCRQLRSLPSGSKHYHRAGACKDRLVESSLDTREGSSGLLRVPSS